MTSSLRAEWTSSGRLDIAQWALCEAGVIEPNPFYGPTFLRPLASHILKRDIDILAIWRGDELVGVMPVDRPSLASGLRGLALQFFASPYITSSMPLIRIEPGPVWQAGLRALAVRTGQVLMPALPQGGPVAAALADLTAVKGHASAILMADERPAIDSSLDAHAYLARYSAKRRKGIKSRERALAQAGDVRIRSVRANDEAAQALQAFLALEADGWKGEAGTALASHGETLAFAKEALSAPNVEFDTLALDGRIIAVNANLVSGGTAFAFKSAYDERFATFSPGAILDQHTLRQALQSAGYRRVDSCATSQHHLMDYWLERQKVETLLVATQAGKSGLMFRAAVSAARMARDAKAFAKALRAKIGR